MLPLQKKVISGSSESVKTEKAFHRCDQSITEKSSGDCLLDREDGYECHKAELVQKRFKNNEENTFFLLKLEKMFGLLTERSKYPDSLDKCPLPLLDLYLRNSSLLELIKYFNGMLSRNCVVIEELKEKLCENETYLFEVLSESGFDETDFSGDKEINANVKRIFHCVMSLMGDFRGTLFEFLTHERVSSYVFNVISQKSTEERSSALVTSDFMKRFIAFLSSSKLQAGKLDGIELSPVVDELNTQGKVDVENKVENLARLFLYCLKPTKADLEHIQNLDIDMLLKLNTHAIYRDELIAGNEKGKKFDTLRTFLTIIKHPKFIAALENVIDSAFTLFPFYMDKNKAEAYFEQSEPVAGIDIAHDIRLANELFQREGTHSAKFENCRYFRDILVNGANKETNINYGQPTARYNLMTTENSRCMESYGVDLESIATTQAPLDTDESKGRFFYCLFQHHDKHALDNGRHVIIDLTNVFDISCFRASEYHSNVQGEVVEFEDEISGNTYRVHTKEKAEIIRDDAQIIGHYYQLDVKDLTTGECRVICRLNYENWRDYCDTDLNELLVLVKLSALYKHYTVHCSAGVGRSGTFIALKYLVANWPNEVNQNIGHIIKDGNINIGYLKDYLDQMIFRLRYDTVAATVQNNEQYRLLLWYMFCTVVDTVKAKRDRQVPSLLNTNKLRLFVFKEKDDRQNPTPSL